MSQTQRTTSTSQTGGNGSTNGHDDHDHDEVDIRNVREPKRFAITGAGVLGVLILVALLVTGLIPRHAQKKELAEGVHEANAPIPVNAMYPKRASETMDLVIPGTLRPWQEVSIFARTSGYLRKYYFDISQMVKAGDLLAQIDTPEVDQELSQAQAQLLQTQSAVVKATSDRDLAKVTWERYKQLKEPNFVSAQEADEKQSALGAAEASLKQAEANAAAASASVQRLKEMQQFGKVTVPFDGVITGRAYDNGSLIAANPTDTNVKPMFKIAQNDVLRAFVNVPQSAALGIRKKMVCEVTARERPGQSYEGIVMGTTNYLDPANRSLLTEVKLPNPVDADGNFALLPGMYVQVKFHLKRENPPLIVPAPAVVTTAEGNRIAVADPSTGVVHFKQVTLGQDFGSEVEIIEGLKASDLVIANPGERITEGVKVKPTGDPGKPVPELAPTTMPASRPARPATQSSSEHE